MTDEENEGNLGPYVRDPRPEPPCRTHRKGECGCEDDGTGATEHHPEERLR